jgi:hypothetical protein
MPSNEATWVAAAYAEITVSQQTAAAEDTAVITAAVAPLVADLTARRVYVLASTASIPDNAFRDLTTLLAEKSAPFFGRDTNWEKVGLAEARLREIDRYSSTPTEIVRRVLELMEVWGQTRNVMDATAVLGHAEDIQTSLIAKRVISSANITTAKALPQLARYVAASLAQPQLTEIMASASEELRRIDRADRTVGEELTRRVLELLEVYGQGRNVMDVTAIEEHATEIIEELAVRGIVTINGIDDIEPAVMPNLARYIAAALSSPPHYPIMDRSARELRTQTRNITDEGVHKTVYF